MVVKPLFFILLIITHNFIFSFKRCAPVRINLSEYNLESLKQDQSIIYAIVNNKIIQAFDYYYYLDNFEYEMAKYLMDLYLKLKQLEQKK